MNRLLDNLARAKAEAVDIIGEFWARKWSRCEDLPCEKRNRLLDNWSSFWDASVLLENPLADFWRKRAIFAGVPRPYPVSPDELTDWLLAFAGLNPVKGSPDFETIYEVFLTWVESQFHSQDCDPFPVCRFLARHVVGTEEEADDSSRGLGVHELLAAEAVLWKTEFIKICIAGIGPTSLSALPAVLARVTGNLTRRAFQLVTEEISRLLPSVLLSAGLTARNRVHEQAGHCIFSGEDRRMFADLLPSEMIEPRNRDFTKACLDAYYMDVGRKDSIEKRIRNAVTLLAEADSQRNSAVGLGLAVSAIEALLGQTGGEISVRLARNCAVLLEPELDKRRQAETFVKNLYNTRSRVLHGDRVDGELDQLDKARLLAAGVLSAVISRREFLRKGGFDPESPDALLRELEEGSYRPGAPIGVDEPRIRQLWASE